MTAHRIRMTCLGVGVCLLIQTGVFAVSAQQGAVSSNVSSATAVGQEAGYQWYQQKADEWRLEARILRALQVLFVAIALVSSVLAASKIVLPSWWPEWLFPVTAALAIALFTGLDINTQANKQREAWRRLTAALAEYRDGDAKIDVVRKAYVEAEGTIGAFNPQATK